MTPSERDTLLQDLNVRVSNIQTMLLGMANNLNNLSNSILMLQNMIGNVQIERPAIVARSIGPSRAGDYIVGSPRSIPTPPAVSPPQREPGERIIDMNL